MWKTFVLPLLALWSATTCAYVNPIECTSGVCNNAHDPSLIRRDDGTYFRFSTGGSNAGAIPIFTAKAINGPWVAAGTVLPKGSTINRYNGAKKFDLWAPDVSKVGDTYYLYYSMSQAFGVNNSTIGVATSKTLETGSWTDLGESGVSSTAGKSTYNAIDGNLVYDGRDYYMSFGSFWTDLYTVKMGNPPRKVASGSTSKQIAYVPTGTHSQEAAYVYKYGSFFYLFFSVGQCCDYVNKPAAKGAEYKIQACRSSAVAGPYVRVLATLTVLKLTNIDRPGRQVVHEWRRHYST
jgi:arabinan endo-1,5-alpha-L-arabinosidase